MTTEASLSRAYGEPSRISMPGYQPLASVKAFTGACGPKLVQYSLYGSSAASRHSLKGYVGFSEKAAFDDCGRLGRLSSTDGSFTAASPGAAVAGRSGSRR